MLVAAIPKQLIVRYPAGARVFAKNDETSGIIVTYETVPWCKFPRIPWTKPLARQTLRVLFAERAVVKSSIVRVIGDCYDPLTKKDAR